MIATLQQLDFNFPNENSHQSLLLNKIMKAVADFSVIGKSASAELDAAVKHAEAIMELNERSKTFYLGFARGFDQAINLYNTNPEQIESAVGEAGNQAVIERIEFFKSKAIEIDLINRPVFDSFSAFEKRAKKFRHPKVAAALKAIDEYKKMCTDHNHKAFDFVAILNQFVIEPSFPNGQSVLSKDYLNSLIASSESFLGSAR